MAGATLWDDRAGREVESGLSRECGGYLRDIRQSLLEPEGGESPPVYELGYSLTPWPAPNSAAGGTR
jgi:hypothetical protein